MRRLRAAGLLACSVLLTGCVGMPIKGPVVERDGSADVEETPGIYFDPRPPQPEQAPTEIVSGFLEAMKATPIRTSVARQFLSPQAQEGWAPEREIMTYAGLGVPLGQSTVSLRLTGVNHYDERGAWRRAEMDNRLGFSLVEVDGQWRIDKAPDALIVPESWFDDWYERVSLHFFDPTAQVLVPEPVFVPKGDQFASSLVRGLLVPPVGETAEVLRTFFPPGLDPGLSVPISSAGIAEVSLTGNPDVIDDATAQRMLTQLVWTLRQEPRIRAVRLSVGDRSFGGPGGTTQVNLDVGDAFDPTGSESSGELFGLQNGRLVRGSLLSMMVTPGPFGQTDLGLRSVGVNLSGTRAAGVTGDGTGLVLASVEQLYGQPERVLSATDLLAPAWDVHDRVWLVDKAPSGARVLMVKGERVREVPVPGVSGREVSHLLVSRDGTRLVSVVRGADRDRVLTSRIRQDQRGQVLGVTSAQELALDATAAGRVRDLAWRSATSVSVLSVDITDDLSQVLTLSVDGAPGDIATVGSSRLRGRARSLVSSPLPGSEVLALLSGRAVADLTTPERALPALPRGLTYLTYVG